MRELRDTSESRSGRSCGDAYQADNTRLTALPGLELVALGRHPVHPIGRRYRANVRTSGRLCSLGSEGSKDYEHRL